MGVDASEWMKSLSRTRLSRGPPAASLEERAEALRVLAGLLRLGHSPRHSLAEWQCHTSGSMAEGLHRVERGIRLGVGTADALDLLEPIFEEDARALSTTLTIAARLGGDSAAMVDSLARSIDRRRAALSSAQVASSGAKLSGRLVAGLPFAFLPLAPMARAPLFDGPGRLLVIVGVGLAVAGMMWIARLMPRPDPVDDPAAALAELLAAALAGGTHMTVAMKTIADGPPEAVDKEIRTAARFVRLGLSWPNALKQLTNDSLGRLGGTLARAQELGLPVANALVVFAQDRRADREREFEAASRRAAVLMMIPLAVCVLPAFILLGVAPFLRGLSLQ